MWHDGIGEVVGPHISCVIWCFGRSQPTHHIDMCTCIFIIVHSVQYFVCEELLNISQRESHGTPESRVAILTVVQHCHPKPML